MECASGEGVSFPSRSPQRERQRDTLPDSVCCTVLQPEGCCPPTGKRPALRCWPERQGCRLWFAFGNSWVPVWVPLIVARTLSRAQSKMSPIWMCGAWESYTLVGGFSPLTDGNLQSRGSSWMECTIFPSPRPQNAKASLKSLSPSVTKEAL